MQNIRGFKNVKPNFSNGINILVGPNNAGKSTILNSILTIHGNRFTQRDITIGEDSASIKIYYTGSHLSYIPNSNIERYFELKFAPGIFQGIHTNIPTVEPHNLIYPYLSQRKVGDYSPSITEEQANSISGNLSFLTAKVDRLINPYNQPNHSIYEEACKGILGYVIATKSTNDGKELVYYIDSNNTIPLKNMGEGVANIVGLIVDLCSAENKIFLIEEPENDIHPQALKELLKLIIDRAGNNQFFISTHSNIVMKYLGANPSTKIFHITSKNTDDTKPNLFLSTINEISDDPIERRNVLEDLGYDFFDFDLWKGWLFLEESSAEIIIRDYLIKWFVPELAYKIRTFSAGSVSKIKKKFDDFNKLFVFLHLQPTYKDKVWVYIDGGGDESEIIDEFKKTYSSWNQDNFNQFKEHDFERYYPSCFQEEVTDILFDSKEKKRERKKDLLNRVKMWCKQDEDEAKKEFEHSAAEIIGLLIKINSDL